MKQHLPFLEEVTIMGIKFIREAKVSLTCHNGICGNQLMDHTVGTMVH